MTIQSVVIGKDSNGNPVRIGVTDSGGTDANGNELYKLQVDSNLTAPSITIGSVRVEDGVASTLATVKAPASVGATDPALAVQNYTIGLTSDAVDKAGIASTINAKLRGLIQLFAAGIPAALGQTTMSASLPVTVASDQSNVPTSRAGFAPGYAPSTGVSGARFQSADASGAAAAVTDAPTSSQKIVLTKIAVSVGAAMSVDFTEQTAGTHLLTLYMAANSTVEISPDKLKLANADHKLMVQTGAAGNIAVTTQYYSEA